MKPYPWSLFIRIGIEKGQPVEEYGLSLDTHLLDRDIPLIVSSEKKGRFGGLSPIV